MSGTAGEISNRGQRYYSEPRKSASPGHERAIEIGTAAEHIVCADLILSGHRAFLVAAGMPYDVILDLGSRLVRVSVKSTLKVGKRPAREAGRVCYQFAATRSKRDHRGKTSARPYTADDTDVMAFVALDLRIVAYAALVDKFVTSWHIDPPGSPRIEYDRLGRRNGQHKKRFEDFTLDRALRALGAGA